MRFLHTAIFLSVLCGVAGLAATTPTKTTAKKATTKVSSTAKTTSKTTTNAAVTTPKTSTSSSAAKSRVVAKGKKPAGPPAPRRQLTPTPDRYKEIQQALIDKGYLHSEPTGVWDSDSVAAMQRFQSDQKQTPTGKITAASLIGLGLGAKSAGAPEAPPVGSTGVPPSASPPQATSAPAASQ